MATTLLKLKELSQQTIEAIVKSPDAWKKYLNAAPNIFRYSFEDQLLIYAQAPKATAVATYDVWNKIMHRAVKKGKHIARAKQNLQTYESQLEDAKIEVMKEFPKEADLKEKTDRLSELNALLNMDQSNHEIVAEEQIEEQETAEVTNKTQRNEVVPKFGTR